MTNPLELLKANATDAVNLLAQKAAERIEEKLA